MLYRFFVALLLVIPFQAVVHANVIYDVTVNYTDGVNNATFSFAMEFASPAPPTKGLSDLIGGDFQDEKFVFNGLEMDHVNDFPIVFPLFFDGTTLSFVSQDSFRAVVNLEGVITLIEADAVTSIAFPTAIVNLETQSIVVAERAVSAPAILPLLGLGFAGLWVSRRTTSRRRAA
jgi:hypothetical protein